MGVIYLGPKLQMGATEDRTLRCDLKHIAPSSCATQFCGAIKIADRVQDYAAGWKVSVAPSREDMKHSFGPQVSLS